MCEGKSEPMSSFRCGHGLPSAGRVPGSGSHRVGFGARHGSYQRAVVILGGGFFCLKPKEMHQEDYGSRSSPGCRGRVLLYIQPSQKEFPKEKQYFYIIIFLKLLTIQKELQAVITNYECDYLESIINSINSSQCTALLLKVLILTNQSQVAVSWSQLVLKFSLQRNKTCSFKECGSPIPLISPLQGGKKNSNAKEMVCLISGAELIYPYD